MGLAMTKNNVERRCSVSPQGSCPGSWIASGPAFSGRKMARCMLAYFHSDNWGGALSRVHLFMAGDTAWRRRGGQAFVSSAAAVCTRPACNRSLSSTAEKGERVCRLSLFNQNNVC